MKDTEDDKTVDWVQSADSKCQIVGYVRVSSFEQNTERQLHGIKLDKVFEDKMTGTVKKRPELEKMLEYVRHGDTVIVHSLDRLARNFDDLLAIIKQLNTKGVVFKSIKENLSIDGTNKNPMDMLILHIFGAVAEFNHALIKENQRDGIARAKARGVYKGRKSVLNETTKQQIEELLEQRKNLPKKDKKALNNIEIAKRVGISKSTLYRYLDEKDKNTEN
ncbi:MULTISPECIES: recombinase family protein [unclassified Acinetobacter]|uniref:recombinase family protein n=1 Tax=unclassified Acinetobacter TaxID=196816 RepID=UPI0035B7C056